MNVLNFLLDVSEQTERVIENSRKYVIQEKTGSRYICLLKTPKDIQ